MILNLHWKAFLRYGYDIKTFVTIICRTGARFSPFANIRGEAGAAKLAAAVISNTEGDKPYDDCFIADEKLLFNRLNRVSARK